MGQANSLHKTQNTNLSIKIVILIPKLNRKSMQTKDQKQSTGVDSSIT